MSNKEFEMCKTIAELLSYRNSNFIIDFCREKKFPMSFHQGGYLSTEVEIENEKKEVFIHFYNSCRCYTAMIIFDD